MTHEPGYDSHRRKCEAHEALGRVERWVLEQQAGLKLQHTLVKSSLLQVWFTELLDPLLSLHCHQVLGTL